MGVPNRLHMGLERRELCIAGALCPFKRCSGGSSILQSLRNPSAGQRIASDGGVSDRQPARAAKGIQPPARRGIGLWGQRFVRRVERGDDAGFLQQSAKPIGLCRLMRGGQIAVGQKGKHAFAAGNGRRVPPAVFDRFDKHRLRRAAFAIWNNGVKSDKAILNLAFDAKLACHHSPATACINKKRGRPLCAVCQIKPPPIGGLPKVSQCNAGDKVNTHRAAQILQRGIKCRAI